MPTPSDPSPIAIVTDAVWRKSVAAIRSLGRAGWTVFALGDSLFTTGFYSRYTVRRFRGPSAAEDPVGFGVILRRAAAATNGRPTVLLPMEDASCEWVLLQGRTVLPENIHWLLPDSESFQIARDKGRTMQLARQLGIPCPWTLEPACVEELRSNVEARDVSDLVLKPRTGSGSGGIVYGAQIRQINLEHHWKSHGALLLQERIPAEGEARGVSLLLDQDGNPCEAFAHRRLRQYPVSGGPSTQRESIALDDLYDHSLKLLKALSWRGVAMVEWKVHPDTGRPILLEINPRFWGSLALAVRAGVDFPVEYAKACIADPNLRHSLSRYTLGVRCRWLLPGDILRYMNETSETRETLREFINGILSESEEFDRHDLRGSLATVLCPAALVLNPKYFRYLRKNR